MRISTIVSTSVGREEHLECCLKMLSQQTHADFEVLVIDDGSKDGERVSYPFNDRFKVTYHWRPNDYCVSRSRNLGALLAHHAGLVFIDTDILLNPNALREYDNVLQSQNNSVLYGYCGTDPAQPAPSLWFPDKRVKWFDERFPFDPHKAAFMAKPSLMKYPQEYGWSGNFATLKTIYEKTSGFNEDFIGWGGEDLEFAQRAIEQGIEIHFSLEVWAENLIHDYIGYFYDMPMPGIKKIERPLVPLGDRYRVMIFHHEAVTLTKAALEHYMVHNFTEFPNCQTLSMLD